MNVATESEYQASWSQDTGEEGWDYNDYNYYDNGYYYAMTQDTQWNIVGKQYSMMLTRIREPPATTGPKHFPVEMRAEDDEDDDDEDEEEINHSIKREHNSKVQVYR